MGNSNPHQHNVVLAAANDCTKQLLNQSINPSIFPQYDQPTNQATAKTCTALCIVMQNVNEM